MRCHAGIMIIFLIILLSIRTVSGNSLLRGNCVSSIKGSVLVKHCYTSLITHNILECYYQCKEDRLCQSLNFYEKKNLCELNNRTRAVGSPNFLSYADSVYLDNPFRVHLGSSASLPAESCQEIKNASEGLAPNGRYWLVSKGSGSQPVGAYCDMEKAVVVEYSVNPCQHGGTCDYQGEGQYTCRCLPGYSGNQCEFAIDECASSPCLNGGTCTDVINGFRCACAASFTGMRCELGLGLECSNYTVNTEEDRSVLFHRGQSAQKCDRGALVPGWYRFNGTAGSKIPSSCVAESMCHTDATGWLNGAHPTLQEGVVSRTVCFHWSSNCCNWSKTIQVRNCGLFFVYKLVDPDHCHLRYCVTK